MTNPNDLPTTEKTTVLKTEALDDVEKSNADLCATEMTAGVDSPMKATTPVDMAKFRARRVLFEKRDLVRYLAAAIAKKEGLAAAPKAIINAAWKMADEFIEVERRRLTEAGLDPEDYY